MKTPPRLPSARWVTTWLRELNEAYSHPDAGGEFVGLALEEPDRPPWQHAWRVVPVGNGGCYVGDRIHGRELVPGGLPFDAVAAAKRLLAAVRDGWS